MAADPAGPGLAALARFVAGVRPEEIPRAVGREAERTLLNTVAAALGGAHDPAVEAIVRALRPLSGPGTTILLGRRERMDAASAATANAAAANALDFDDAHPATVIHPGPPVVAAALSAASLRRADGAAALDAVALGVETACRLGVAAGPGHYRRGFHVTATCGAAGAAAAAARLLGLDAARTAHAIGIAATGAAGLVENLGSGAKSVGVGDAARHGLLAALFAAEGVDAAPGALEGPRGFLGVLCDDPDQSALAEGLGVRWEAAGNTYKPYPCGVVLNPVVDAVLEIRASGPVDPDAVAAVEVSGPPLLLERTDRPGARRASELRLSLQHAAAVVLVRGRAGLDEFADDAGRDPAVLAVRALVSGVADPSLPAGAARVRVAGRDGRAREALVVQARGSSGRPLADADLEAKLRDLAARVPGGADADRLLSALRAFRTAADAHEALAAAQG